MPSNRNILYLVVGALLVAVGVLGYLLYQERNEPGVRIRLGPVQIEGK